MRYLQESMSLWTRCLSVLGVIAVLPACASAQVIIVNAANKHIELSKDEVSNLFLKKTLKWNGGKSVVPVDQDKSAKVRELFSKAYHGRSPSAIESFWQQQIFSGKDVPPAVKTSDEEVIAFVKANPNAIGYVSAGTELGDGVKVVKVSGL